MKTVLAVFPAAALAACPQPAAETAQLRGTVHFSFEQAELVYQNKLYYLEDSGGLLAARAAAARAAGRAYAVTLNDVCIRGRILSRADNNGSGFGHLGRYGQAVAVESLC